MRIILLLLTIMIAALAVCQDNRASLEKKRKEIEEEIDYTNKLLTNAQKSKTATVKSVKLIESNIKSRERLIESISLEVSGLNQNLEVLANDINYKEKLLHHYRIEYSRLIKLYYLRYRSYDFFQFVFSSGNIRQAYNRLQYYRQYANYRKEQIRKIAGLQKELTQKQKEMLEQKEQKRKAQEREEMAHQKLLEEKGRKSQALKKIQKQESELRKSLAQKQKVATELSAAIRKLIEDEIRASQKKTAATNQGNKSGKKMEILYSEEEIKLSQSFIANMGKLPWPVNRGIITEYFGEHPHPVLKGIKVRSNGISITTDKGAQVKAIFKGTVSKVFSISGINNIVIVKHGEFRTVYSNLGTLSVKEGQELTTEIGRAHV